MFGLNIIEYACEVTVVTVILSDVMVIMLANVSKFHEFRSGREQWIFKGDKYILSADDCILGYSTA
jgi:hypothetical protein